MHEYPMTERIVNIAVEHCQKAGGTQVESIKLVVGEYSGMVPESIQMYFDVIAEGTPCQNAVVEIERIRAKVRCRKCGEVFRRKPNSFNCPVCDGEGEPTEIGKEFYIDSIEVR